METSMSPGPAPSGAAEKRPEPLFILCPPRSYSSVISGIIGQHPQCYGLPELNLMVADTLGEVWNHASMYMRTFGRDGLLRTIAELHERTQTADSVVRARDWIEQRADWSTKAVFDHIQELAGPRILVEKSPLFVHQKSFMDRLLGMFPNANLLHLTRHPRSMGASVVAQLEKQGRGRMLRNNVARDPEEVWLQTHQRVLASTEGLPVGQCMRLKGEAFLAQLDTYLPQVCDWLGIRRDDEALAAMLHPEDSPYAAPGPRGAPRGNDPNFLEEPQLDFERVLRIKEPLLTGELSWRPGGEFGEATVKLAKQLGYS
jgi:hypothetical protein